MMRYKIHMWTT